VVTAAISVGACGGAQASGTKGDEARFLMLAHQPLSGQLGAMPNAQLLDLGHQACAALDAQTASDAIVSQLGGGAEPGSAAFNTYSFLVVDAASELCPQHKSEFSSPPS
jgi:Protein of unknown function (DUF732)